MPHFGWFSPCRVRVGRSNSKAQGTGRGRIFKPQV